MADPLTPHDIEQEILRLNSRLESATEKIRERAEAAGQADADHKVAYAKAMLAATGGTVAEREAQATITCETELREARQTRAVLDSAKQASNHTVAQLDSLRSLAANVRGSITHSEGT